MTTTLVVLLVLVLLFELMPASALRIVRAVAITAFWRPTSLPTVSMMLSVLFVTLVLAVLSTISTFSRLTMVMHALAGHAPL